MSGDDPQVIIEEFEIPIADRSLFNALTAYIDRKFAELSTTLAKRKRGPLWDITYKGDEDWLKFRLGILDLIKRNIIVGYSTLDQIPDLKALANIKEHKQWYRAIDQRLVPNQKPRGLGVIIALSLEGYRERYVTFPGYLHCAICKAAQGRRDMKRIVKRTLELYMVEECMLCEWKASDL